MRGLSSAGRAPALHAGGQGFDPPRLHHIPEAVPTTASFHFWAHPMGIGAGACLRQPVRGKRASGAFSPEPEGRGLADSRSEYADPPRLHHIYEAVPTTASFHFLAHSMGIGAGACLRQTDRGSVSIVASECLSTMVLSLCYKIAILFENGRLHVSSC